MRTLRLFLSLSLALIVAALCAGATSSARSFLDTQPGTIGAATQWGLLPGESGQTDLAVTVADPSFAVFVSPDFATTQHVGGFGFRPGSQVTIQVDNGNDGTVDFQQTRGLDPDGVANFSPAGNWSVGEGDLVRLYDDQMPQTVKETIVQYLTLSTLDVSNDVVAGTARAGTHVFIHAPAEEGYPQIGEAVAGADGRWQATVGYDLRPGTTGFVQTRDPDGDATQINWSLPRPQGWQHNPVTDHYYLYVNAPKTWADAEAFAASRGGHLVTVNDAAEEAWLVATFGTDYWIGFNDRAVEGTWVWASGEPVTFTNWLADEPNDSAPGEDAGRIENRPPIGWNDLPDDATLSFVVERSNPPQTSFMVWMDPGQPGLQNRINGMDWSSGVEVTVTADNPETPAVNPDITTTLVTDAGGGFDGNQLFPGLRPGWLITVTDGVTTKTHTLRNISITDVDPETDITRGTADPFTEVWVSALVDDPNAGVFVTAGGGGEWSADLTGHYDIRPGSEMVVLQKDADGDATWVRQTAPAPSITIPPGTSLTTPSRGTATSGVPMVYWEDPLTVSTTGCSGGTATATLTGLESPGYVQSITLTEAPAGTYTGTFAAPFPHHGSASISIAIDGCSPATTVTFTLYIDPSGVVRDTFGDPVVGATVTLYRSSDPGGPFVAVPDGSTIMSAGNRANPDLTGATGLFGWDVTAGYYKVRAEKAGCTAPGGGASFVETGVLTIPPPVTDLALVLSCPTDTTPPTVTYSGNAGSYTVDQQVNITCVAADEPGGSGIASTTCANVVGPAEGFGLGTKSFSATATDNAGNTGSGSVSFTVTVTPASLCNLTMQFAHQSAKYVSSTAKQKVVFDKTVNALCTATLSPIKPGIKPAAKKVLIAAYKLGVNGLAAGGWLTKAQANELAGFASGL